MRALSGRDPATGRPLTVTIADGRVAAIEPGAAGEPCWLTPGLVDLQVNGYGGHDRGRRFFSRHDAGQRHRLGMRDQGLHDPRIDLQQQEPQDRFGDLELPPQRGDL